MSDALYGFLARLGYSHPLHPIFVHMPVGLTVAALCFWLAGTALRRRALLASAHHAAVLALLFLAAAVPVGVMDWQRFYGGAWLLEIQAKLGLAGALLLALALAALAGRRPGAHPRLLPALYMLGVAGVGGLGFFGGQLVFRGRSPEAPEHLWAGQMVFDSHCSGCHGRGGNVFAPNLPLRSARQLQDFGEFVKFVRDPRMPDGQPGPMPKFDRGRPTDEELRQLYDYLHFAFVKPARDGE